MRKKAVQSRAVSRPQNNINNHGQMEVMMDACCGQLLVES